MFLQLSIANGNWTNSLPQALFLKSSFSKRFQLAATIHSYQTFAQKELAVFGI